MAQVCHNVKNGRCTTCCRLQRDKHLIWKIKNCQHYRHKLLFETLTIIRKGLNIPWNGILASDFLHTLQQRGPTTFELLNGPFYKNVRTHGPLPTKWCRL